jgi:hypothetical protein
MCGKGRGWTGEAGEIRSLISIWGEIWVDVVLGEIWVMNLVLRYKGQVVADDMSMQQVQPETIFYRRVKFQCERMERILKRKSNSVFVCSIYKFCDEFDTHHNTRQQFIEQCQILENARQGYKKDELTEEEERGFEYPRGNQELVFIYQVVEDLCVCIETYLEQRLFGVWFYTDKGKEAPEFSVARQTMNNLVSLLMEHACGNELVMWNIRHLQENFESVISDLKWCHAHPGAPLPADESHHAMHVESLLQSLARLSDARPLDLG